MAQPARSANSQDRHRKRGSLGFVPRETRANLKLWLARHRQHSAKGMVNITPSIGPCHSHVLMGCSIETSLASTHSLGTAAEAPSHKSGSMTLFSPLPPALDGEWGGD